MNTNYLDEQIARKKKHLKRLNEEKQEFLELIDGVEKISIGFSKIAKFLKSTQPKMFDSLISDLEDEIREQQSKVNGEENEY